MSICITLTTPFLDGNELVAFSSLIYFLPVVSFSAYQHLVHSTHALCQVGRAVKWRRYAVSRVLETEGHCM